MQLKYILWSWITISLNSGSGFAFFAHKNLRQDLSQTKLYPKLISPNKNEARKANKGHGINMIGIERKKFLIPFPRESEYRNPKIMLCAARVIHGNWIQPNENHVSAVQFFGGSNISYSFKVVLSSPEVVIDIESNDRVVISEVFQISAALKRRKSPTN